MDLKRKFGVEIEHGNADKNYVTVGEAVRKKFPKWTNTGSDGSGIEVRSPILQGQGGFDELGEVMEYLKELGGFVTTSDGMHVHHDASDFVPKRYPPHVLYANDSSGSRLVYDPVDLLYRRVPVPPTPVSKGVAAASERVLRVLESYHTNQRVINQLCDPYRRKWADIQKAQLNEWKRRKIVATGRRNIHYTLEHGTFEFRQFEGCLEPVKALAWIEFGQHFLNYTKELTRPASCAMTAHGLLKRIGVSAEHRRALIDRPRTSQLKTYHDLRLEGVIT